MKFKRLTKGLLLLLALYEEYFDDVTCVDDELWIEIDNHDLKVDVPKEFENELNSLGWVFSL